MNEKEKFIQECTGPCDWDGLILERFNELAPKDSIVVDVGANHGVFSFALKDVKEIYAIEPDIENFNILKSKSNINSNIKLINVAISDNVGKVDIYEGNGDHATRNILGNDSLNNPNIKKVKIGTVDCATLDFIFIEKLKIQPNACKIDTEGAETLVLKGGKNVIKGMDCVFVEIHNNTTYREIIEMCFENEWKVCCLKNLHEIKSVDELEYCYQVIIFPNKK